MSVKQVTTEEGKNLANQFGCPFFETSACERHCIDEPFYTLVREIRRKEVKYSIYFYFIIQRCINNNRLKAVAQVPKSYILVGAAAGGAYAQYSLWYFGAAEISIRHTPIHNTS